jgi:hypothetical protein
VTETCAVYGRGFAEMWIGFAPIERLKSAGMFMDGESRKLRDADEPRRQGATQPFPAQLSQV